MRARHGECCAEAAARKFREPGEGLRASLGAPSPPVCVRSGFEWKGPRRVNCSGALSRCSVIYFVRLPLQRIPCC